MSKIMLVEDDNNLREIYEARLIAEGYEIVSAADGEQALAIAVKEKPDLIIADIMMPKISGFDMLDILRSTPETKDTKVIMMTALSQAEDKARADKLGADRYLVKSQVTLEDVAKVAKEVLADKDTVPAAQAAQAAPSAPADTPVDKPSTGQQPATQANIPVASAPTEQPQAPPAATPQPSPPPAPKPAPEPPAPATPPAPQPTQPTPPQPPPTQPPQPPAPNAKPNATPPAQTTAQEEAALKKKIDTFVQNPPHTPTPAKPPQQPSSQPTTTAPDATNAAADTAAQIANAANDLLQKQQKTPAPTPPQQQTHSPNQIAGKKIVKPISDIKPGKSDLNELLAKEGGQEATPPPTTSVVSPGGETVTPAAPSQNPSNKQAGNVIQPGGQQSSQQGQDPNSVAL